MATAQLSGLTFTAPVGTHGAFNLTVTATSSENGTSESVSANLGININEAVNGVSSPTLSVSAGVGIEDTPVALNINAGMTNVDGSEVLTITIAGVPAGGSLSAGINNGDGTWTLTAAQLSGLTFSPPAHSSGNYNLTVTATVVDNGNTESISTPLGVNVTGVATPPLLSVSAAAGTEDTAVPLNINAALQDTDGSETLTITISGVPAGASLSAGHNNGDGTWTLSAADLSGLNFIPPAHASGTFNLTVTATSTEDGTSESISAGLGINITGTATAPTLSVAAATGAEDTAIPLNINAALVDTDGSETLSITIAGIPAGGSLSAGTNNGDGTWTLTSAQLSGLTFTPPAHASGTYSLTVTATSTEDGTSQSVSAPLGINVTGVATAPTLSVSAATGTEDTAIPLNINAALVDNDGSETLSITIAGVPAGASLSAGVNNGDGTWTLTSAQLSGLTFTPPAHSSGTFNLTVTATSTEDGTSQSVNASLNIDVAGTATAPLLSVSAVAGVEDTAIPLNISAALQDTDGSETLSITIAGVPTGASLSAGTNNGDGTWTLTSAQLSGLTFTPPAHASGAFNLTVTATSTENGTSESVSAPLGINVSGTATPPLLSVTTASGVEDTAVALNISAALQDTDGSETLSITISGVPAGASLSAGTDNGDGTWTLTSAQLSGLTFTPPAHASGAFNLTVTATSSENGTTESVSAGLGINISGAATPPLLSVSAAAGIEDTAVALNISAALQDTDGSETLSITIAGVPAGASLSAGTNNGDGTWTLTSAQLSGLTFTPPAHASGAFNLTVTATSSENGTSESISAGLGINISGAATPPLLSVSTAAGVEDTAVALNISAALQDTDGSETLSITIAGVPAGASLSAGTNNGDGTWTLTSAQLSGLTFTPPAHASGVFNLTVTATSSENGTTESVSAGLGINIAGAATPPLLSVSAAAGVEDTAVALNISAALQDTDGSETLSITIAGVPAGASLSAGINNGDGTWTLTSAQLSGLTFTPPANASGNFNLTVTATSSENGTTESVSAGLGINISGVATTPTLSVGAASGLEDTAVALNINAALVDTDGSETLSITIAGVPAGASLSAGVNNGDGTWTLTAADLSGLTFTPPLHASGNFNLTVTATSSENGTTESVSTGLGINIAGVATAPTLSVSAAAGIEDTSIPLNISAALVDTDGSETLSITIAGVPAGASLSAGINNGDGTWTLSPANLSGLTFTPPAHASGAFNLTVTATSTENGTTESVTAGLGINVSGVATPPTLSVGLAAGLEDTAVALNINAALVDTDGSETLSITVAGVPAGASLSAGTNNGDGTWTLTSAQLTGLTFTPPLHASGTYSLSVTATSSENGTTQSITAPLGVQITGVATAPTLSVTAAAGIEDTSVALNINAALVDTDGSETLSITVAGVPAGGMLSAGVNNGDGTWTLTSAQLSGLTFTPPAHASGNFGLTVTATSSEEGTTQSVSMPLQVSISGVATAPTLNVQNLNGLEDTAIGLNIGAALVDTDGSETLSITIAGVPAGATLSAGTNNGGGNWTLTPAQLSGLTMTPPLHFSGDIHLSVSATSSENGTTATTSANMDIQVAGVATMPLVSVLPALGNEDTGISLNINAALVDTDGSETLSIVIGNVPAGATLSAGTNNGNGTWTLTPAQLTGLTFNPPAHASGAFNLTVSAVSSENGTTATATTNLPIAVTGIATAPTLSVSAATGAEDSPIALNIGAALVDTDGSETLSITITGVPTGAVLSAGVQMPAGTWTLTPAQLSGLTMTAPHNFSGAVNLTVTATSHENGTTATAQSTLPVVVTGVADTPALSVSSAAGNENTPIALNINAGLTDTDGSEILSINISGVPAGATLSAGTNNGGGNWTLTPAQLTGLTLNPPPFYSGAFNLSITATSSEDGTTASISAGLPVTVAGIASAPILSVHGAVGLEDHGIPVIISAALSDTDGSETLSVTVSGVPAGATLSAGTNNGGGIWTLTPVQLVGLMLNPPANFSGNINLSVTATASENGTTANVQANVTVTVLGVADAPIVAGLPAAGVQDVPLALAITAALVDTDGSETLSITVRGLPAGATLSAGTHNGDGSWTLTPAQLTGLTLTPPAHWAGNLNLSVTATSSENGTTADTTVVVPVTIAGLAPLPTLHVVAAAGLEDQAISLDITASVASPSPLSITVGNLPAGATLSAGTQNPDGTWTLTSAQLVGLKLNPPQDWSGSLQLQVSAHLTENGDTSSTSALLPVVIAGVADAAHLTVQPASGNENSPIALNISAALTDTDGSETLSIVIGNLPAGATLSAGHNNGNGTWTLTPAELTNLNLIPAAGFSGSAGLSITAITSEGGTTAVTGATLGVTIAGVATTPDLHVVAAVGVEDTAIALNISAASLDLDGSETVTVTIAGLPAGATLSSGTHNPDNTWTLTTAQLTGLTITPPANYSGNFSIAVTATAAENGTTASTSASLPITVTGVADTPALSVQAATGSEDQPIALNINAALTDTDGSETLAITIAGVPPGATLSAGSPVGGGVWTLTPAQLTNLTITPPTHWSGNFNLTVTAVASEGATVASTNTTLNVNVAGVATTPLLSVNAAVGVEDAPVSLMIAAALADTDGSETLSITVSGLPAGAALSAGTNNGNGSWTLTSAQLTGLKFIPAANWNGNVALTVTATSHENGTTASTGASLSVSVAPVADAPSLTVQAAVGVEDVPVPLAIAAALAPIDLQGNLTITLSNLPAGASLSAGVRNANGSWTLSAAQLVGLTMIPPANWSGSVNLSVTATATDGGTSASTTANLGVSVAGVADTPHIQVQAAVGMEDNAIPLHIQAALTDTDGSESLSIAIGGMPIGATLSAGVNNGDGTWTLTAAQLTNLTITPPANWSGTFTIAVTAASAESGTWATSTIALPVTVISVADTPLLAVAAAIGAEDTAIPLVISAGLADVSETLSITISGLPAGASLSAGVYAGGGMWSLSPAQLAGLKITPPADFSGTMTLQATAISTASNGDSATMTLPINVTVTPQPDAPLLTLAPAVGFEDTQINLNIGAVLKDVSETMTITIAGVPAGATLSAGTFSGGLWRLTPAQLAGLKITPPANSDADFTLTVTATSTESNGTTASVSGSLGVTVLAVADIPTVSAANVVGLAGAQIGLNITGALADTDGSESISYIIHGVPDGFALSKGINNGDNTWTLTTADLSGLKIVTPPNLNFQLNLYAQAVARDNDGSVSVSAPTAFNVRGGDYGNGYLIDLGVGLQVGGIGAGVQVGLLPPIDLFPATGGLIGTAGIYAKEDTTFQIADAAGLLALPILSGVVNLVAKVQFQGIPAGVTFSNGINKGGGVWEFSVAQLTNLHMTLPANSDNDFTIVAVAKMLLGLLDVGLTSTQVHVMGVADIPTLSANIGNTAEGQAVALNITGALTDTDGSETLSYLVSGMPAGFMLNKGINNGNGTWSLKPADLTGLTVIPSADFSGTATVKVSAVATEREGDQAVLQTTLNFNVAGVADAPIVAPLAVVGTEDHPIALNLGIALRDTDGSETISAVTISGLPAGASLIGATDNHNGTWSVNPAQLGSVQFVPGSNWHGDATLTVSATSRETSNGSTATTTASLNVHVNAEADTPSIMVTNATGSQGQAISLTLGAGLTDPGEHLSAVISGVPDDAILSAGHNNGNGTWSLRGDQLSGLKITPAHDFHGDLNLSLTVHSREDNGSTASAQMAFNVHVTADPSYDPFGSAMPDGSWLDASTGATGGTPDFAHTPAQNAQEALDAAHVAANNAGHDYQQAFQSHETG